MHRCEQLPLSSVRSLMFIAYIDTPVHAPAHGLVWSACTCTAMRTSKSKHELLKHSVWAHAGCNAERPSTLTQSLQAGPAFLPCVSVSSTSSTERMFICVLLYECNGARDARCPQQVHAHCIICSLHMLCMYGHARVHQRSTQPRSAGAGKRPHLAANSQVPAATAAMVVRCSSWRAPTRSAWPTQARNITADLQAAA